MLLGRLELLRVADLNVDVAQVRAADHALHRAGVRHDHDVILVYTLGAQSLGREDAEDREWDLLNSQNLANRIFVTENLCRSRAANHANSVRAAHILRGKWRPVRQRPLANIEVIGRLAVNPGKPVLISRSDLRCLNNLSLTPVTPGFRAGWLLHLQFSKCLRRPNRFESHSKSRCRKNQNHIFSETRDLRLHLRFRAVADSHHRNNSATPMIIPSAVNTERILSAATRERQRKRRSNSH